ncbi:MAG: TIGR02391 family protein [Candidatus Saccharimonadaceae bacterium]
MNDERLDLKLAEIFANLEQRTDTELISIIKETLTAVATGYPIKSVNEQYKAIYNELDTRLNMQKLPHLNEFDDLWSFHSYWTENGLETYASRRSYVRKMYREQTSGAPEPNSQWSTLHPVIVGVAKSRFDSGHYSDAVEASYKEINSRIKEEVRQRTGKTLDGASLMTTAFSPDKPIIILENLESEDGRNVQQGYMMMLAGAMIAIRNPKAHSNDTIEPDEAMPLIQIASHLFGKYDAAANQTKTNEEKGEPSPTLPGVYVWIEDPDNQEKLVSLKNIAARYSGKDPMILVLGKEKRSAIRMPFTVNKSKEHASELEALLGKDKVVFR